jgi:hypothetical protein
VLPSEVLRLFDRLASSPVATSWIHDSERERACAA